MKKEQKGITLIALVITIIVILILAGVSISSLTGENGVLTKTSAARIKNEIASVQEKANFAYADINADNIANKLDKSTRELMDYVANNLNEEGYETVLDTTAGVNVTGISVSEENIYLVPTNEDGEKTKDITVSLVTEGDNLNPTYLVTISNEKYRMSFTDGEIKISDEPIKADEENKSYTLTITPTNIVTNGSVLLAVNGENITSEKEIDITDEIKITINSTSTKIINFSDICEVSLKLNKENLIGEKKILKVKIKELLDKISKSTSYVGYYADIDADGTVDGIIYADLAKGDNIEKRWDNDTYTTYTIPTVTEGLKDYYISQTNYKANDGFGTKDVISPIGTGKERFYIMALKDITKNGPTYDWYNAAYTQDSYYDDHPLISQSFGKGKSNTTKLITKWNAKAYGDQDKCSDHKDMWGQIQEEVNNGWFVPSLEEWLAFAGELGITSSNYENFGVSNSYWSSSIASYAKIRTVRFTDGCSDFNLIMEDEWVRLSTTF